jgi:hypothetical protein
VKHNSPIVTTLAAKKIELSLWLYYAIFTLGLNAENEHWLRIFDLFLLVLIRKLNVTPARMT